MIWKKKIFKLTFFRLRNTFQKKKKIYFEYFQIDKFRKKKSIRTIIYLWTINFTILTSLCHSDQMIHVMIYILIHIVINCCMYISHTIWSNSIAQSMKLCFFLNVTMCCTFILSFFFLVQSGSIEKSNGTLYFEKKKN